jgi:hypothetical protein
MATRKTTRKMDIKPRLPRQAKFAALNMRASAELLEQLDRTLELYRAVHPEAATGLTRSWLVLDVLEQALPDIRLQLAEEYARRKGVAYGQA